MTTVGERLDFIRKQKGLSYKSLADLIGSIGGDAMRKAIFRDTVKPFYINVIAEKLDINADWILTGKGDMELSKGEELPNNQLYFEKNGVKVAIKEILDFFEDNQDDLMENDHYFRLYHQDKVNKGVFDFINNKEK